MVSKKHKLLKMFLPQCYSKHYLGNEKDSNHIYRKQSIF